MSSTELSKGIRASIERHKLSDGSMVDDVMIRWDGGSIKIAAESEQHAKRLFQELANASHVEITTWPKQDRPKIKSPSYSFLKKRKS